MILRSGTPRRSISPSSFSVIVPAAHAPTASNTLTMSSAWSFQRPGRIDPPYKNTDGRFSRAAAINMPGRLLSHPANDTSASSRSACITHSTESAMISRDTSEAAHPFVSHRDAVGYRDRHELDREATGVAHADLRPLREPVERHVAGRHLVPRRRNTDLRLAEVGVGHADRAQHRAGRSPLHPVRDLAAAGLHPIAHGVRLRRALPCRPLESTGSLRARCPTSASIICTPTTSSPPRSKISLPRRADLCTVTSIGRSHEGRDIWLATVTNSATGTAEDKPAVWVDANIHATEITGSTAALHLVHRLVTEYGTNERITRALDTRTFYVVPRVNPDGVELALASNPTYLRSSTRKWPRTDDAARPGRGRRRTATAASSRCASKTRTARGRSRPRTRV